MDTVRFGHVDNIKYAYSQEHGFIAWNGAWTLIICEENDESYTYLKALKSAFK